MCFIQQTCRSVRIQSQYTVPLIGKSRNSNVSSFKPCHPSNDANTGAYWLLSPPEFFGNKIIEGIRLRDQLFRLCWAGL